MIFNFGSISDLNNKLKLLTNRVSTNEALDDTQNYRLTTIEAVNVNQDSRLTSVEIENNSQNTKLTNLEVKTTLNTIPIASYINFKGGFSANPSSYMRKDGNIIDLYLVVNGTFSAGTNELCTINTYLPYSSSADNRRFPVIISNGGLYTYGTVDTSSGLVRVIMPRDTYTSSVIINLIYTV